MRNDSLWMKWIKLMCVVMILMIVCFYIPQNGYQNTNCLVGNLFHLVSESCTNYRTKQSCENTAHLQFTKWHSNSPKIFLLNKNSKRVYIFAFTRFSPMKIYSYTNIKFLVRSFTQTHLRWTITIYFLTSVQLFNCFNGHNKSTRVYRNNTHTYYYPSFGSIIFVFVSLVPWFFIRFIYLYIYLFLCSTFSLSVLFATVWCCCVYFFLFALPVFLRIFDLFFFCLPVYFAFSFVLI